jgi:4-alpha-glucanotransferase
MDDIIEQTLRRGIETEYVDAGGRRRVVSPLTLLRLVEAIPADRQARSRIFAPTIVARRGREVRLKPSGRWQGSIRWEVFTSEGIVVGEGATPGVALPGDLPLGRFDLRISFADPTKESEIASLLVVPECAYQGDGGAARMWALAVQLYGIRSRRNWGHGDFTDLVGLIDLAAQYGAAGIGLNPLHDTREASPYSPNSRLFLNVLYIDVEAIPAFPGIPLEASQEIETLRSLELIDYSRVRRLKLHLLRLAYDAFDLAGAPPNRRDFAEFCKERSPALQRFACFEVLRGRFEAPWWEWPEPWRKPGMDDLDRLLSEETARIGFFEFMQWQADRQLGACRDRARQAGMTVGLYIDVAIGVQPDGFDGWDNQASMLPDVAIGAPPDSLNTAGQDWGLAAFNPLGLEASGFELFREVLANAMRYAGAVRLDHVLGLKRLFLIPRGLAAGQGAYVQLPFEALLAVATQESVQNRCIVIGEDLGTVPENFRETLADWGLWSYQVMLFRRVENGDFLPPESYPQNALVAFATHDLPTFAGWIAGHDLSVKSGLGIDPGESPIEREHARRALQKALSEQGLPADFLSVARYLAATSSRLLMIAMEDILGMTEQVNLPGTVNEYPNWRRRLPILLDDLRNETVFLNLTAALRMAGRSAPRPNTGTATLS